LRARTELVRAIDGGQGDVIEVRKVVGGYGAVSATR